VHNEIILALEWADRSEDVSILVITGAGDYFSSSNDLSNFSDPTLLVGSPEEISKAGADSLTKFVHTFIDFSKPLIAAVNGTHIELAQPSDHSFS